MSAVAATRGQRLARITANLRDIGARYLGREAEALAIKYGALVTDAAALCAELDALTIPEPRAFKRDDVPWFVRSMPLGAGRVPVEFEVDDGLVYATRAWIGGAWVDVEDTIDPTVVGCWEVRAAEEDRAEGAEVVLGHQIAAAEDAREVVL